MNWPEHDLAFMRAALKEAGMSATAGEVPVGALVVQRNEIIGLGHNRSITDCDPSAHAEVVALRAAGKRIGNHRLTDATLYVSLEPCPMCLAAAAQARIVRLVFGAYDPKAGAAGSVIDLCDSKALNHRMEVNGGVLAEECSAILRRFFTAKR
jgi:tRNA(adenine34) deaminase